MYFLSDYAKSRISGKKISTNTTCVFSFSVCYEYGARNLDEYFHFYRIASQKYKMKEIFLKNLNNYKP